MLPLYSQLYAAIKKKNSIGQIDLKLYSISHVFDKQVNIFNLPNSLYIIITIKFIKNFGEFKGTK